MKLTTGQAAEKLGVTTKTVNALIQKGVLHDLRSYGEGAKRKNPWINSKEVNELAKSYKPHRRHKGYVNGHAPEGPPARVTVPLGPTGISTALTLILKRVIEIDERVDRLLKIWQ